MKHLAAIAAAVGLAAIALTSPAGAATPDQLANAGYSLTVIGMTNGCNDYLVKGFGANVDLGSDCTDAFQTALDLFWAGNNERKLQYQHPAAVTARAALQTKGYTVATNYTTPTFRVTGGCGIDSTVDSAGIVTLNAALPTAAPCRTVAPPPQAPAPAPVQAPTPVAPCPPCPATPPATTPAATTPAAPATTPAATPAATPDTTPSSPEPNQAGSPAATPGAGAAGNVTQPIAAHTSRVFTRLRRAHGAKLTAILGRSLGTRVTFSSAARFTLGGKPSTMKAILAGLAKSDHGATIIVVIRDGHLVVTSVSLN